MMSWNNTTITHHKLRSSAFKTFSLFMSLLPVTGLNVLSVWARIQEAGQAIEAGRNGVPLVEPQTAAQRVRSGCTGRAQLGGHLQKHPSRTGEGWGAEYCYLCVNNKLKNTTLEMKEGSWAHSSLFLWSERGGPSRSLDWEGWPPSIWTRCCHTLCTGRSSLPVGNV